VTQGPDAPLNPADSRADSESGLTSDERPDGRRERSFRTRKLLIEAYLGVASEKKRIPTSVEVASRARVSQRSVFERFGNLDALGLAAFDYILEHRPSTPADDVRKADRQTRVRFQVGMCARSCEIWLPVWRLVVCAYGASPALEERVEKMRALARGRLEHMYRPELDSLAEPARNAVLIALEALTDWACWVRMREHYGHSFDQACNAWIEAIERLLPPTPAS
jgi:AcrR family transcriptional regulator